MSAVAVLDADHRAAIAFNLATDPERIKRILAHLDNTLHAHSNDGGAWADEVYDIGQRNEGRTIGGMMLELASKAALVFGGAMGIGQVVAKLLFERSANVTVSDRQTPESKEIPSVICDMARAGDPDRAVAAHLEHFGRLDIVVDSAGIQRYDNLEMTTDDASDEVIDVNP